MTLQYTPTQLIHKISQNNFSYTTSRTKKITETDTNIGNLNDKSESLKKSLKKLKRYSSGGTSKDMLEKHLTDFLKSYNDMKESSESVTDKDVQNQLAKLDKLFTDHKKELRKIGVEQVYGKYTLDSKTFEDAKDKNIESVLTGYDSFLGKADKIMRKLDETAGDALYDIVERKISSTTQYNEKDLVLASCATLASVSESALNKYNPFVQAGNYSEIKDSILGTLDYFADSTMNIFHVQSDKSDSVDNYYKLCIENKDTLAKVGLIFDGDTKSMTFDDTIDMTTSDFKSAYNALFGDNADFRKDVSAYCKDIINDTLQPEKIGVSLIDMQV